MLVCRVVYSSPMNPKVEALLSCKTAYLISHVKHEVGHKSPAPNCFRVEPPLSICSQCFFVAGWCKLGNLYFSGWGAPSPNEIVILFQLENWYCWWFKNLANQHSTDRMYQNPVITGGFLPYLSSNWAMLGVLNQSSSVARQRWKPWCILLCATQRQHSSVACPFGRRPLTAWFLFTCRVGVPCGFQHWHGLFMLLFYFGEGGFSRAMVVKSCKIHDIIYIFICIFIYIYTYLYDSWYILGGNISIQIFLYF